MHIYIYTYVVPPPPPTRGSIPVLLLSLFCQVSSSARRFYNMGCRFRASREVPTLVLS